ncbi:unnamed protein product [Camellia sinensis]
MTTSATFLRVVGSELIQKYLGDGSKLVRELFRVADDLSPSIVFIDEIDAVGTKRYDAHSGGEREIQRTMLELLKIRSCSRRKRGCQKDSICEKTLGATRKQSEQPKVQEVQPENTFGKVLSMSDATKTILEVPRSATNLPEESKEVMVVKDQTGRKWKFEVAIKDDEKQKRLQGEWSQFTKAHGLMKGVIVKFYFNPNENLYYVELKGQLLREAQRKQKGPEAAARLLLPTVTPLTKCKLRLLKLERIKDYLLMEEEFVTNQERLKPQEEKTEEDRSKVDDLRGSPMSVGNLEELIDENHAIVSSSVGPEYYVGIFSGCGWRTTSRISFEKKVTCSKRAPYEGLRIQTSRRLKIRSCSRRKRGCQKDSICVHPENKVCNPKCKSFEKKLSEEDLTDMNIPLIHENNQPVMVVWDQKDMQWRFQIAIGGDNGNKKLLNREKWIQFVRRNELEAGETLKLRYSPTEGTYSAECEGPNRIPTRQFL